MAKYYAPNFSGLLPLFDGKSAAGGKLYAYRAGSSIPAPLFDEDGVELGTWVSIDSNGCADFLLDSALTYKLIAKDALGAVVGEWDNVRATNAPGGMDNPMTAPGDIIVGGTGGAPVRLARGNPGQMLTVDNFGQPHLAWVNVPEQPGDHNVIVTNADASAGTLADKLVAGTNITLTTQTDGSGFQTYEISATGGGGGEYSWAVSPVQSQFNPECNGYCYGYFVGGAQLPSVVKSFTIFARQNPHAHLNFTTWAAIYDWTDTANNRPLKSSFTWTDAKHPSADWSNYSATFNYDSPVTIDRTHMYEIVWHYHSGDGPFQFFGTNYFTNVSTIWGRLSWSETANYGATPKASFNDYSSWTSLYQAPYIQLNSWSV